MEINKSKKPMKTLERVKGIEPSYSAWKAAALPLSYTRARPINYHAGQAGSTAMEWICPLQTVVQAAFVPSVCFAPSGALNTG